MNFFVPGFSSIEQAQNAYEAFRKFSADTLGWEVSDKQIYAVRYRHNGADMIAQVGSPDVDGETVLAIFESQSFVVCTENRGGFRGEPILIGKDSVSDIEMFA